MLLLLLSCTDAPPASSSWADCPDPTCRHERLEASWQSEPEVVMATLPGLDPIEQATLVQFLLSNYPQQQHQLCSALPPDSAGGQRCQRVQARPHLTQSLTQRRVEFSVRPGGGPTHNLLPPPKTLPPDWMTANEALLEGCKIGSDCVGERARQAARSGDISTAGALCFTGFAAQRESYWECLFETAEDVSTARRIDGWPDAVRLCNATEAFVHGCLHHTLALALPDIPPADGFGSQSIEAAQQTAQAVSATVGGHDLGRLYVDRVWASWTWQAHQHALTVTGQLLPVLPTEAHPHVRLAAAYHLLAAGADWSQPLSVHVAALQVALAVQDAPAEARPPHTPTFGKLTDFWSEDRPGEEGIPAVYCTGDSRRPTDPDPATDATLAVLEAAGRLRTPPPAAFFSAVVQDAGQAEVVRWTAARLLAGLYPADAAALPVEGLTPLITQRLR